MNNIDDLSDALTHLAAINKLNLSAENRLRFIAIVEATFGPVPARAVAPAAPPETMAKPRRGLRTPLKVVD